MVSRNYSAVVVNEALGMNLTQLDMVTVSSQEDIGLVQAVGGWNSLVGSSGKQVIFCSLAFFSRCITPPPPPTWTVGFGDEHLLSFLFVPDNIALIAWHAAHYYNNTSSIGWLQFTTDHCFNASYQLSPTLKHALT